MEASIQELIDVSRKYGQNPDYIIAGGGNTSYKDEDEIWVKASGTSMAEIDEGGFVCLDRKLMSVMAEKQYSDDSTLREQEVKSDLNEAILYPKEKRPSVEASMHEIIQYPFIVHTHPTLVNGLMCAVQSKEIVSKLFGDDVLYVEYTDPGYILFKAVLDALKGYRAKKGAEPKIIFLENHGVFVGANTCAEIDGIYDGINAKLQAEIKSVSIAEKTESFDLDASLQEFFSTNELGSFCTLSDASALAQHFVKDIESFASINIPFTPDNIVYCKSCYLFVEDQKTIAQDFISFNAKHGYYPKIIAVKGTGLIAVEENAKSAQIVLDVYKDMIKMSHLSGNFGGPRPMNQQQIDFIDNWEVENYRRKVSKES